MNLSRISLTIIAIAFSFYAFGQLSFSVPSNNPVELGMVNWLRSYDEALNLAKEKDLPVFILFQEVPGCSTCTTYGNDVLSHPFVVEAIESHFVPLVIYNNKGGQDAKILKKYNEPSWNNPVARIVNHKGKDIVARHAGNYTKKGIVDLLLLGLTNSNQLVPKYLSLYQEELNLTSSTTEELTLSMFCFWTGEKEIGKLPGVFKTAAGFMNGREVVHLAYDPSIISDKELIAKANKSRCADKVFTNDEKQRHTASKMLGTGNVSKASKFRLDKDQKYYLKKSVYAKIPMTHYQSMKANSLIGSGQSPEELLSPRQLQLLETKIKKSSASSFVKQWYAMIGSA